MSDQTLVTIEAQKRTNTGKGHNRKLRASGKLPANLLEKGKSTMIEFDPKLLPKAYATDRTFNLSFNGQTKAVKIHELHVEPVSRKPLHADLIYC
jgi:ribosomal protein L25 (general stress protein Ctc)